MGNITEDYHHRIKNILQNIISYTNILSGMDLVRGTQGEKGDQLGLEKGGLSPGQTTKLTRYIHGLALLQDLLHQDNLLGQSSDRIRIDRAFTSLLSIISQRKRIDFGEIPILNVSFRKCPNLLILLLELIDTVAPEDHIECLVSFSLLGSDKARVSVQAQSQESDEKVLESASLNLIRILFSSDKSFKLEVRSESGWKIVMIDFELS
jgi:hypothetical protein